MHVTLASINNMNSEYQKPLMKPGERGVSILTLDDIINGLVTNIRSKDQNIKEVLLKIKLSEDYKGNQQF